MKGSKLVLSSFKQFFLLPIDKIHTIGEESQIPCFVAETVKALLLESKEIFLKESLLLKIDEPCVVIGDTHGNIFDLIRIFAINGLPPKTKYLFLGNYIDFGEFQIESICLLLAMHNLYPGSIHLLHGSHEFSGINERQGFFTAILDMYRSYEIWQYFNEAFSLMPIAAILNNKYFCVNSGISPQLVNVDQIKCIERPIEEKYYTMINDFVNAEPSEGDFDFKNGPKQGITLFGTKATTNFLTNNNLVGIIRSHHYTKNGIDMLQDDKVISVCSTCNPADNNRIGYLIVGESVVKQYLEPMKHTLRQDASFFNVLPQRETANPFPSTSRMLSNPNKFQGRSSLCMIGSSIIFKKKRQILQRSSQMPSQTQKGTVINQI